VRAALLGTLVLYALPLEDAVAVARFLESLPLGPGLAAAALAGIVAVRLVRELCPGCKQPTPLPIELTAAVALAGGPEEGGYARAPGCDACDRTGSRGRRPLFEVVALDKDARARLLNPRGGRADLATMLAAARPDSIRSQAIRLAAEGVIGVDELLKVL
jgi:type II secretory ATPase GspE/PulE/Tfp pilus assembly ATPase PilB-like protein